MVLKLARKFKLDEVEAPEDVEELFYQYTQGGSGSGTGTHMNSGQLQRFLVEHQGVDTIRAEVATKKILEGVQLKRHHLAEFCHGCLSLDDFFDFLFSVDLNPPFLPQVHQDMTLPLSHYFICTGHNSYLSGNQLTGDCSEVQIIKALKQGVRVIELDLWPTKDKNDIRVDHGSTLTSPVDLKTCLLAIKKHAFDSSNKYPVIITLEDHLNLKLQVKAAKLIDETFGDLLLKPSGDSLKEFPSPEALKGKILISTKPSNVPLEAEKLDNNIGIDPHSESEDAEEESPFLSDTTELSRSCLFGLTWFCRIFLPSNKRRISQNLEPFDYNKLIAIPQRPKGNLKQVLQIDPDKVYRVSLKEKALKKSHGQQLVRFTQRNILRIYPNGTRIDSSNYNPFTGWMDGAQMVAFNMQGYGSPLWKMQGMFKANGGCGYVRKPDFLMNDNPVVDTEATSQTNKTLKVKIYMGDGWKMDFEKTHFNKYSPPDFYVTVGIAGVPVDATEKFTKTRLDQWTPIWNQEFTFQISVPELAVLSIEVSNYKYGRQNSFAGQNYLPIPELRSGIYAIPLYNEKGERYKSVKLLMRFIIV